MTFYLLAGEESVVEMVKDLMEVLHALVPLEMRDNGNPRSIWGNPRVQGSWVWFWSSLWERPHWTGKSCSSMTVEWKSSPDWQRCLGHMENILKFPLSPEAALGEDQKGGDVLQKGCSQETWCGFHVLEAVETEAGSAAQAVWVSVPNKGQQGQGLRDLMSLP